MENKIMPKEIKEQVEVTKYVCSNCGAVHKSKLNFDTCAITGEEVCDNCEELVHLMEIDNDCEIGSANDYEVYLSDYAVPVKKELVVLTDSMLEYETDDYRKVVISLYEDFCKKMQEAHRAYLQGKIRDFDKLI